MTKEHRTTEGKLEGPIPFWGYKEQETHLILHEHNDDDDDDKSENYWNSWETIRFLKRELLRVICFVLLYYSSEGPCIRIVIDILPWRFPSSMFETYVTHPRRRYLGNNAVWSRICTAHLWTSSLYCTSVNIQSHKHISSSRSLILIAVARSSVAVCSCTLAVVTSPIQGEGLVSCCVACSVCTAREGVQTLASYSIPPASVKVRKLLRTVGS
jgi:hypothetical protein